MFVGEKRDDRSRGSNKAADEDIGEGIEKEVAEVGIFPEFFNHCIFIENQQFLAFINKRMKENVSKIPSKSED